MASRTAETKAALLALQPCYADLILGKKKRVEFRKRRFQEKVTHIIMYATVPIQAIVGFFEVHGILELPVQDLWDKYHATAGIDEEGFFSYFGSSKLGVAIEVGKVIRLEHPIPLSRVGKSISPPQSFIYLPIEVVGVLKGHAA
jgi:predicted transcriptional regulator